LVFYNSTGAPVTSGTGDLANAFAYAVGTTAFDSGANKATLFFDLPNHGEPVGTWTQTSEGGPTNFVTGLTSAPTDIQAAAVTNPVVATGLGADISSWLNSSTPDPTAGYANTIEVRLQDSGPGQVGNLNGTTYWETDIGYNTTSSPITVDNTSVPANGWAELF
jgi:hypothetical protein